MTSHTQDTEIAKRHEAECLKLIYERDAAEEALSQAYYLVIGHSPEWSNLFGYDEALEEIKDASNAMKAALKSRQPHVTLTRDEEAFVSALRVDIAFSHKAKISGEPLEAVTRGLMKRFEDALAIIDRLTSKAGGE